MGVFHLKMMECLGEEKTVERVKNSEDGTYSVRQTEV
jgi:hypothetical protein